MKTTKARTTVAVVMPVYNDSEGLRQALTSFRERIPFDVIVVDDGSDPPVDPQQCESWAGRRVTVIRHQRNLGIVQALNTGMQIALQKEYAFLARMDAGDQSMPNRLERQRDFLLRHPAYGVVGGQAVISGPAWLEHTTLPTDDEQIRKLLRIRNCFLHSALMFRASALQNCGLYTERYPYAEDYELILRLSRHWKVANLAEVVVRVAWRQHGLTNRFYRKQSLSSLRLKLDEFGIWDWYGIVGMSKDLARWIVGAKPVRRIRAFLARPNRRG